MQIHGIEVFADAESVWITQGEYNFIELSPMQIDLLYEMLKGAALSLKYERINTEE